MDFHIDINNLSQYEEDHRIEVKKAKSQVPDSLWSSYSAFANTDGGIILLGVDEKDDHSFVVKGVVDAHKIVTDFWNMVNNRQKVSLNILTNNMVKDYEVDGKTIVVIEVPRAERTMRPVYVGQDPMKGTYVRWGEGDHLCDRDQIAAIYRDAAASTCDTKVLKGFDMSVFDMDTVHDYRNYFNGKHPGHVWSKTDDVLFLRYIGAMGFNREDGKVYPTVAGLLMFGHEYDIVREFPDYFLDYQEKLDPQIRWTHRLISSSGDWSGNLFDFFFHVYNRLKKAFPVPFQLSADGSRNDEIPMYRALREMITNSLAHTDYYGRQGVVISRKEDTLEFANPGDMRTGLRAALSGGHSDARNSSIMKMFGLLDFGERAGSGIPDLFDVCHTELSSKPLFEVTYSPARTKLIVDITRYKAVESHENIADTSQYNQNINDRDKIKGFINDKLAENKIINDKFSITNDIVDKLVDIFCYLADNGTSKADAIAKAIGMSASRTREYLQALIAIEVVKPEGGNRNRTYQLNER